MLIPAFASRPILLALNAAIEAARLRARQGRRLCGVVADEVRAFGAFALMAVGPGELKK